jgi:hypothetical protein
LRCPELLHATFPIVVAAGIALGQNATTGSSACISCHATQTIHQTETPMAQATLLSADNPVFKTRPTLTAQKGRYTYTIETRNGQSIYSVSDSINTLSFPIRWTIGQRMQTWIVERDGHYFESLVSYYPRSDRLDVTVGDERILPQNLNEAVGRELSYKETTDCFGCHSTNSVAQGKLSLNTLEPGVTCEHCHSGASTHAFDAVQGIFDSQPRSLKQLSSEELNDFCGRCHRSWETVVRTGIRGVPNVRFQPYRLANSTCFDGADRRLSCIACHDPHQNVVRQAFFYDKVCMSCHRASVNRVSTHSIARTCPKATADCVSCHMPKVEVNAPGGRLTFTDHHIRIGRSVEGYPN